VTLRARFRVYLVALHVVAAALAVGLLRSNRAWLIALEVAFVASLSLGLRLVRATAFPLELIRAGSDFLADGDFTHRLRRQGLDDVDALVDLYNRMADNLRDERVRLQEQQYLLEKLVHASPSGVLLLDFDANVRLANPAAERLLERSAAEIVGRSLASLASPLARAASDMLVDESRVVAISGGRRVMCRTGQFLDRGFARGFVIFEELTEQLRQSEKAAYEKLIRLLAHEVNNSLGAATSLLHSCLLYRDQLADADRDDFETAISVAISRSEHLAAFMRGFSEVVRVPDPKPHPCDVRALLEGVVQLFKDDPSASGVAWVWDVPTPFDRVALDRILMEQVFVNIVKNAVEAVAGSGTVTIRLLVAGGRPMAVVEDSGDRLTADVKESLFTPFFTTKEHGQGLGLTFVQDVLRRHGFDFSLEGGPGEPTRFTIVFA
jgi:two-component system, NtrC family, nitrogen regulation sensor histidine kinase NtrY